MNANAYSEDQMIQAGTADFFEEHLGWRSVYAFDREGTGPDSLLGRSHRGEVVLVRERHFGAVGGRAAASEGSFGRSCHLKPGQCCR